MPQILYMLIVVKCVSHFQEDYDKLCNKLNLPKIQVPHLNKNSIGINKIIDFKLLFNKIYFD